MMRQQDDCAAIVELVRSRGADHSPDSTTGQKWASDPSPADELQGFEGARFGGASFVTHLNALLDGLDGLTETSALEARTPVPVPAPPPHQTEDVLGPSGGRPVDGRHEGEAFSTGLDALLDGLDGLAGKSAPDVRPPAPAPEPPPLQAENVLVQSDVQPAGGRPRWSLREALRARSHLPVVSLRAELGAPAIGAMVAVALITAGLWPLLHQATLVVPGGVLLWFTLPSRAPFFQRASSNESRR